MVRLPAGTRWYVLGWVAAEAVTFLLLVKLVGFGTTVLLGLATTVLGVLLLRRAGLDTMRTVRRGLGGSPPADGISDGLLSGFGALLLILPGFLLNLAGLALAAPSSRRALLRRFGPAHASQVRRSPRHDVLDLDPTDWRPLDRP